MQFGQIFCPVQHPSRCARFEMEKESAASIDDLCRWRKYRDHAVFASSGLGSDQKSVHTLYSIDYVRLCITGDFTHKRTVCISVPLGYRYLCHRCSLKVAVDGGP